MEEQVSSFMDRPLDKFKPVRLWNKNQGGGQSLRKAILDQVAATGDKVKAHKVSLNFLVR